MVKVDKSIQAVLNSESQTAGTTVEGHREFEVLDTCYLTTPAPDGKPLQNVLLKVVK